MTVWPYFCISVSFRKRLCCLAARILLRMEAALLCPVAAGTRCEWRACLRHLGGEFFLTRPLRFTFAGIFSGELCSTFYSWSSMLGQRTNSTHTGCDISHSNSPCPLGPLTTHIPSAISISDTAPLDSRLWSDRTGSTRVAARPVEATTDISAWSRPWVPHASV